MSLLNGTESIEQVESIVCEYFGTNIEEVYSRNKKSAVALARHFIIYILNTNYSYSQKKLSLRYNRSFFTIRHSIRLIRYYIDHYKDYKGHYQNLISLD